MTDFEAKMAALKMRFAARAAEDAAGLERAAGAGDWDAVRERAHGLAGRAGMFGHPGIGDAARSIEEEIDAGGSPVGAVVALAALLRGIDQGL
ncbi:Hpt domain-containing protein [Allosphingosinicella indica]|uniref:Hpt domain-containing protein n=1 Tax=Allosphingosinicella indica TaxID=941907 RepID=A0A1X7FYJ3_9SPHN|nr:Hpt domain-containing protein [Allosphingosinicella indica]SMF61194.1 Hpt domain-containing protein [Allosphingosinicella indica]